MSKQSAFLFAAIAVTVSLACLVVGQEATIPKGFKIENPLGGDPLLESKESYFGLNIPYIFEWKSKPYAGMADLSSSLFKVKLLNGLLLNLEHDRTRNPITNALEGQFSIRLLGIKLYDYADELAHGRAWFHEVQMFSNWRNRMPNAANIPPSLSKLQADAQQPFLDAQQLFQDSRSQFQAAVST